MLKVFPYIAALIMALEAYGDDPPVIEDYFPEDGAVNVDPYVVIWIQVKDDIGINWSSLFVSITADDGFFNCDTEVMGSDQDFTMYFYALEPYEDAFFECEISFYDLGGNYASVEWSFTTGFLTVKDTSVGRVKTAFAE